MSDDADLAAVIEADEKTPTPRMPRLAKPRPKSNEPVRKVWVKVVQETKPWAEVVADESTSFDPPELMPMIKGKRYCIYSDVAEILDEQGHLVILESPK